MPRLPPNISIRKANPNPNPKPDFSSRRSATPSLSALEAQGSRGGPGVELSWMPSWPSRPAATERPLPGEAIAAAPAPASPEPRTEPERGE